MDKIKILIAEDSVTQAMQLQHILEKNGYDATVVSNGSEALRSISKSKPMVVISDIMMPEMDGYELSRQIKANDLYRDISVILLTSLSQPQAVIWALQCGADKFITKPYDENHLLSTIQHLNQKLNSQDPPQKAINVSYRGETYFIDSPRSQIINLLLSTYEAAVNKNLELIEAQDELKRLNQGLEEVVDKRTAALRDEIVERKLTEAALREAHDRAEWLARFPKENPNPVMRVSADGSVLYCNPASVKISGWECKDGQGLPHPLLPLLGQAMTARKEIQQDVELGERSYSVAIASFPGKGYANVYGVDITERKCAELRERLEREVLEILNRPESPTDTIRDILQLIKNTTGVEALGIRLQEGDDFPYYENNGFSEDFIEAERYLCTRDEEGKIIRDGQGNPVLECMCGNIITGRANPTLPFFTKGGSFWTNCTTELLASTTEEDRQARTRTRCNGEGYESVALIPLRSGDEIIGLLQLNDRRCNQFTLKIICFFEGLGASIGIALSRKRAEEEIKKYSAQLIEKNDEIRAMTQQLWQSAKMVTMGELSASVAHELNNPLATVSLRVESLLEKTPQDNSNHRELEIIQQEIKRMATLIANLLQFSRRGQQQISTVDICEEIEKTLELIDYHLRKYSIVIRREFPKEAPRIHADRQQLLQLFLNLFTNASDAMPRGGTLTIRVTAPSESKQVIIEIADTGTGIPPEILPKVAEPFFSTKPEGKGTGLGLAICRRIVKEHKGTFDLLSEGIPGRGTTARIALPVTNGTNSAGLKDQ
jgi:signal transduction histidine kinase/CheY-like chemotaxis protein/PAS domain-containing protein